MTTDDWTRPHPGPDPAIHRDSTSRDSTDRGRHQPERPSGPSWPTVTWGIITAVLAGCVVVAQINRDALWQVDWTLFLLAVGGGMLLIPLLGLIRPRRGGGAGAAPAADLPPEPAAPADDLSTEDLPGGTVSRSNAADQAPADEPAAHRWDGISTEPIDPPRTPRPPE